MSYPIINIYKLETKKLMLIISIMFIIYNGIIMIIMYDNHDDHNDDNGIFI